MQSPADRLEPTALILRVIVHSSLVSAGRGRLGQSVRKAWTQYRYTGKLSCLRPGISTVFPRSIASARAMRGRVAWGMITSSI
jgi:hypothetical protein